MLIWYFAFPTYVILYIELWHKTKDETVALITI